MSRSILGWLALAVFVYTIVCIAVYFYQRSLMYFPQPRHVSAARAATMKMPVNGAEIIVTVRQQAGPKAILYFGGNGEDASPTTSTPSPRRCPSMRCTSCTTAAMAAARALPPKRRITPTPQNCFASFMPCTPRWW